MREWHTFTHCGAFNKNINATRIDSRDIVETDSTLNAEVDLLSTVGILLKIQPLLRKGIIPV